MRRIALDDLIAILGLMLLAAGVGARWGFDLAAIVVGILLIIYAVAASSRGEVAA